MELALIDARSVTSRQYDSCLPAGQRSMTLLLACVLWSVECWNALGQSRVAPVG